MKILFFYIVNFLLFFSSAFAQQLNESEINTLVSGNTLTGRSVEGRFFSEYHLADGRVFGNNGYYENTDACWIIKSGEICYYYGEGKNRSTSCFALEKSNNIIKMVLVPPNPKAGTLDAFAKIENGDARNHLSSSAAGKQWTCDGLVSSMPHSKVAIISIWANMKFKANLKPRIAIAQLGLPDVAGQRKTPLGAIPRFNNNLNPKSEKQLPPGQIAQPSSRPAQSFSIKAEQNSVANSPYAKSDRIQQKLIKADTNTHKQKTLPVENHLRPQPLFATSPNAFKAQTAQRNTNSRQVNSLQVNSRQVNSRQVNPPVHLKRTLANSINLKAPVIKNEYAAKIPNKDSQFAKPIPVIQRKICAAGKSAC